MLSTTATDKGLYGVINHGLPVQTGIPVYSIAITMSQARTSGATQIYPPLARTGNLIQLFDPTNAQDLSAITPSTGTYSSYCIASGCDYTVRVTYTDGSQVHRVLQGGFRNWLQPTNSPLATTSDPTNPASFNWWVINVPGTKTIRNIELLNTPMVWNGLPSNPTIITSR